MHKTLLTIAAATLLVPAFPAAAKHHDNGRHAGHDQRRYYNSANGVRYWQGNDGHYYCHRSNGTTGTIVGAAGGALAGRAIDTQGDRATGTILGAAAGALLGRAVDRGHVRCQ